MNFLFWTIFFALFGAAGIQYAVCRRGGKGSDDRNDELLSITDVSDWPLKAGTWSLEDIELLAASDRVRAVVTIDIDGHQRNRRRRAIKILAHTVYRHIEVEAVFIEAWGPWNKPDLYLFAADGRGWWGHEIITTALKEAPVSKPSERCREQSS